MKTRTWILLSLLAAMSFAAMGYVYVKFNTRLAPASPPIVSAAPSVPSVPDTPAVASRSSSGDVPRFFTNDVPADWRAVESEDYHKYIANLRAIGCPEPTIRDIIIADVNKLYAQREKALGGPPPTFEYWKKGPARNAVSEKTVRQRIELAREKRAVLKELLGADVEEKALVSVQSIASENRLAFLPTEKQQQVSDLEATYTAKANEMFSNTRRPTREDLERFRKLRQENEAELAKTLSPQELDDYNLRFSPAAQYVRGTMGDFELTEQEFRTVYQLRKQFDEQYGPQVRTEEPTQLLGKLEMEKQMRAAMGEERYTQYVREQSWSTSSLRNVADQFGVPKETAVRVFDLKPVAQQRFTEIYFDQNLSDAQRQQALKAVQTETVNAIGEIIGAEAAQAYYQQGAWIRALAPQPAQSGQSTRAQQAPGH